MVGLPVIVEELDDRRLFLGIEYPVEHPGLGTALECRLMLQNEGDVLAGLPFAVPWNKVISDDAQQAESVRLRGKWRVRVRVAEQIEIDVLLAAAASWQ
jgi:hypothetical protein